MVHHLTLQSTLLDYFLRSYCLNKIVLLSILLINTQLIKEATHNFTDTIQKRSSQQLKLENVSGLPTVTLDELAGVSELSFAEGSKISCLAKNSKKRVHFYNLDHQPLIIS